ncbi:MAG: hypothetical protein JXN64_02605 [Spirochaetes bacterium]|nr:hypothetical protein [Spirochaetota bacterium]
MIKRVSFLLCLFAIFIFAGCSDDKESNADRLPVDPDIYAVIGTVAADYTSAATSFILDEDLSTAYNNHNPLAHSDHVINIYGEHFYDTERFGYDAITKYRWDAPNTAVWNYSVIDAQDITDGITTSNPYAMVFVNETKAYVIRYGSKRVWIVNPSTVAQVNFKTGSLDLTEFVHSSDTDGVPDSCGGLIIDGKIYIANQTYDINIYSSVDNSTLAVFNTATDTVIDANGTADGNAIDLGLKNVQKIKAFGSKIYTACVNDYSTTPGGGISVVDTTDYSVTTTATDKNITNVAILSETKGYFVQYVGWGDNAIYSFNPTTGEVAAAALITGRNIADIEISPDGDLWIADASSTDPGIYIYDTDTDTKKYGPVSTYLNPSNICFFE